MNKELFDNIILKNLKEKYPDSFGYCASNSAKSYECYYSNAEFASFIDEMKKSYPEHYRQYDKGKGSELKEKKNGTPPKMASVGSSSRFCFIALKDGASRIGLKGIPEFEHSCRIDGIKGNTPQLDAFFKDSAAYFEVKCHEIFDEDTVMLSNSYWNKIYGNNNDFGFPVKKIPENITDKNKRFTISLQEFGFDKEKTKSMFNIKQLICHLLGIKNAGHEKSTLIYLFFIPKCNDSKQNSDLNKLLGELKTEIRTIFSCRPIRRFCAINNITLKAIAEISEIMQPVTAYNTVDLLKSAHKKISNKLLK